MGDKKQKISFINHQSQKLIDKNAKNFHDNLKHRSDYKGDK